MMFAVCEVKACERRNARASRLRNSLAACRNLRNLGRSATLRAALTSSRLLQLAALQLLLLDTHLAGVEALQAGPVADANDAGLRQLLD